MLGQAWAVVSSSGMRRQRLRDVREVGLLFWEAVLEVVCVRLLK